LKTVSFRFFNTNQLGVGIANRGEAIVHAIAAPMENLGDEDGILQIDFSIAFNQISRVRIFELTATLFKKKFNLFCQININLLHNLDNSMINVDLASVFNNILFHFFTLHTESK
jgi:hypothetical protein